MSKLVAYDFLIMMMEELGYPYYRPIQYSDYRPIQYSEVWVGRFSNLVNSDIIIASSYDSDGYFSVGPSDMITSTFNHESYNLYDPNSLESLKVYVMGIKLEDLINELMRDYGPKHQVYLLRLATKGRYFELRYSTENYTTTIAKVEIREHGIVKLYPVDHYNKTHGGLDYNLERFSVFNLYQDDPKVLRERIDELVLSWKNLVV